MIEKLVNFIDVLNKDDELKSVTKEGYCRDWTKMAAQLARNFFEPEEWGVLAMEVPVDSSIDHTFLRVRHVSDEQLSFFYDGTGTYKFEPYFGPEKESPEHFKNNRIDRFSEYF